MGYEFGWFQTYTKPIPCSEPNAPYCYLEKSWIDRNRKWNVPQHVNVNILTAIISLTMFSCCIFHYAANVRLFWVWHVPKSPRLFNRFYCCSDAFSGASNRDELSTQLLDALEKMHFFTTPDGDDDHLLRVNAVTVCQSALFVSNFY